MPRRGRNLAFALIVLFFLHGGDSQDVGGDEAYGIPEYDVAQESSCPYGSEEDGTCKVPPSMQQDQPNMGDHNTVPTNDMRPDAPETEMENDPNAPQYGQGDYTDSLGTPGYGDHAAQQYAGVRHGETAGLAEQDVQQPDYHEEETEASAFGQQQASSQEGELGKDPSMEKPQGMVEGHPPEGMVEGHPPEGMVEGHQPEGMVEGHPPEGMVEGHPPEGMAEGHPPEGMAEGHPPEGMTEGQQPERMVERQHEAGNEQRSGMQQPDDFRGARPPVQQEREQKAMHAEDQFPPAENAPHVDPIGLPPRRPGDVQGRIDTAATMNAGQQAPKQDEMPKPRYPPRPAAPNNQSHAGTAQPRWQASPPGGVGKAAGKPFAKGPGKADVKTPPPKSPGQPAQEVWLKQEVERLQAEVQRERQEKKEVIQKNVAEADQLHKLRVEKENSEQAARLANEKLRHVSDELNQNQAEKKNMAQKYSDERGMLEQEIAELKVKKEREDRRPLAPGDLASADWKGTVVALYSLACTMSSWFSLATADAFAVLGKLLNLDPPANIGAGIFLAFIMLVTFIRLLPFGSSSPVVAAAAAPPKPVAPAAAAGGPDMSEFSAAMALLQQQVQQLSQAQEQCAAEIRRAVVDNANSAARLHAELQAFQRERSNVDEEMLLSTKEILEWMGHGVGAHTSPRTSGADLSRVSLQDLSAPVNGTSVKAAPIATATAPTPAETSAPLRQISPPTLAPASAIPPGVMPDAPPTEKIEGAPGRPGDESTSVSAQLTEPAPVPPLGSAAPPSPSPALAPFPEPAPTPEVSAPSPVPTPLQAPTFASEVPAPVQPPALVPAVPTPAQPPAPPSAPDTAEQQTTPERPQAPELPAPAELPSTGPPTLAPPQPPQMESAGHTAAGPPSFAPPAKAGNPFGQRPKQQPIQAAANPFGAAPRPQPKPIFAKSSPFG